MFKFLVLLTAMAASSAQYVVINDYVSCGGFEMPGSPWAPSDGSCAAISTPYGTNYVTLTISDGNDDGSDVATLTTYLDSQCSFDMGTMTITGGPGACNPASDVVFGTTINSYAQYTSVDSCPSSSTYPKEFYKKLMAASSASANKWSPAYVAALFAAGTWLWQLLML